MPRQHSSIEKYKRNLSRFLSYIDQVQYPALADFSNERLNQITDKELHRFLCFLAYGKENPGKEDHSTEARSNHLKQEENLVETLLKSYLK